MTPGFAKPRSELPWLPYGKCNRVIINAHNFTSTFNPAVNGKSPFAVWCPSRDDVGNGTTTLRDLVGSNHGTLNNFALTGSTSNWVVDTSAGGIRALDFDGTNDYVSLYTGRMTNMLTSLNSSISMWVYVRGAVTSRQVFLADWNTSFAGESARIEVSGYNITSKRIGGNWMSVNGGNDPAQSSSDTTQSIWTHIVMTRSGSSVKLYVDGSLVNTITQSAGTIGSAAGNSIVTLGRGGAYTGGVYLNGRMDDIRVFNAIVLDASDVSWLYNTGSGRGRSA